MSELLKPYLIWLHLHPHWGGLAAFIVSFIESLAVLGLLIPGTVAMTAVGVLIGTSVLPPVTTMLWAIAGAIAGDVFSFWLGYHYHQKIREYWPFRRYPKLLEQGELFFAKHGGKGVFLGRFIGPMRPLIPLIAGMMSMPPVRFITVDIISGILWAPAYMLPGILIGAASQELPPETATRLLIFLVIVLLLFWCVSWLLKKIYFALHDKIDSLLARGWSWMQRHPRLIKIEQLLRDPRRIESHGQLGLSVLTLIFAVSFITLACSVAHQGFLTDWNIPAYHLMRSLRTTTGDQIMVLITFLGEAPVLLFMWMMVLGWLLLQRHWRAATHWFLAGMAFALASVAIKHLVHSPRPIGILKPLADFSFPSGHTTGACLLFGYLAFLLSYNRTRIWQWSAAFVAGTLIIAITLSRLYLGAHWLTDILGGITCGLAILGVLIISYRRQITRPLAPLSTLSVALFALLIAWGWSLKTHYLSALHDYTPYWPSYKVSMQQWWQQAEKQAPQFRYNRFGKPIQVINLQWAGTLGGIKNKLEAQGWHKESRRNLVIFLSGLVNKDNSKQLPILSQLYEDRRPVLIMTKYLAPQKTLLILRLWDAHLKTDTGLPLWLGAINYHHGWRHYRFLSNHDEALNDETNNFLPATQLLINDLNGFMWKRIQYHPLTSQQKQINWDGYVLLVRPLN